MNCAINGLEHTGVNKKIFFQHNSLWWQCERTVELKKSDSDTFRVTPSGHVKCIAVSESCWASVACTEPPGKRDGEQLPEGWSEP